MDFSWSYGKKMSPFIAEGKKIERRAWMLSLDLSYQFFVEFSKGLCRWRCYLSVAACVVGDDAVTGLRT